MSAEHDVDLLVRDTFFPGVSTGVLVEVGAARPDYLSISASFRRSGWQVIAVEPNPQFCAQHRALGYDILEFACSNRDADDVEFTVIESRGSSYMGGVVTYESFSSLGVRGQFADLLATVDTGARTIRVNVRKLDTILEGLGFQANQVDVLAVDVEGWELEVMEGFDLEFHRPSVLILENLFEEEALRSYAEARGYRLWRRLQPNDIYVRVELLDGRSA
jgi:FkbM family methyltransferase